MRISCCEVASLSILYLYSYKCMYLCMYMSSSSSSSFIYIPFLSFLPSFFLGIISHSFIFIIIIPSQIRLFGNRTLQLARFECQTDVLDRPFLHGGLCLEDISLAKSPQKHTI